MAESAGVSVRLIQQAKAVAQGAPELQEAVLQKNLPLTRAAEIAKLPREQHVQEIHKRPAQKRPAAPVAAPDRRGEPGDMPPAVAELVEDLKRKAEDLTKEASKATTEADRYKSVHRRLHDWKEAIVAELGVKDMNQVLPEVQRLVARANSVARIRVTTSTFTGEAGDRRPGCHLWSRTGNSAGWHDHPTVRTDVEAGESGGEASAATSNGWRDEAAPTVRRDP